MKLNMKSSAREITTVLTILIVATYFINFTESRTVSALISSNRRHGGGKTQGNLTALSVPTVSLRKKTVASFDEDEYYSNVPTSLAAAKSQKSQRSENPSTANLSSRPAQSRQISAVVETGGPVHEMVSEEGSECGRHKACAIRETSRAMRVEMLKRDILKKLNMVAPPNVTRPNLNSSSIKHWLRRYNIRDDQEMLDDNTDDFYDDEVSNKRIMKIAKAPELQRPNQTTKCCSFSFTEDELQYDVTSAHLMLYVRPLPLDSNLSHRSSLVIIRRYLRPLDPASPPPFQKIKMLRVLQITHGYWLQVNLDIVRHWFLHPEDNYGLDIISREIPDLIMTDDPSSDYTPVLDVALKSGHRRRHKRDAHSGLYCDAERNQDETRCCMYDLRVNFEQIGWDWIIYPVTYNARYCSGECAFLQLGSMRSKLIRQANFNRQNKTSNCCVPKKLVAVSLLYFDESETVVYSSVPDMQIRRCDCM